MSNPLNITLFPPDTICFNARQLFLEDDLNCTASNFTITQSMLIFLNLTADEKRYRQAYCIAPPSDDTCAFGYCPNGDIAGPLVRIASYTTNICLSLLIFYSPERARDAFWSQVLSIYALLITCAISIFQTSLTRFHAAIAVVLTGSPLSFYLFIYSVMSFWYRKHRLNGIVGEGQMLPRVLILTAGAIWGSLLIYILVPTTISHFAQESCDTQLIPLANYLYIFPFRAISALKQVPYIFVAIVGTIVGIAISWIIGIVLQRETIWPHGERWSPRFGRTWSVIGRNYSFIHFLSIVAIPTFYWVSVVELGCFFARNDEEFSLSFGQVMAIFVALPPLIQTILLYPMLFEWFRTLTWVRRIYGPKNGRLEEGDQINLVMAMAPTTQDDADDDWKSVIETADYTSVHRHDSYQTTHRSSKLWKDIQ